MRISLVLENILTYLGVKSCTKVTMLQGFRTQMIFLIYVYYTTDPHQEGRRHKATRVTCEQAPFELHVPLSVSLRLLPRTVFFNSIITHSSLPIHAQVIRKTTLTHFKQDPQSGHVSPPLMWPWPEPQIPAAGASSLAPTSCSLGPAPEGPHFSAHKLHCSRHSILVIPDPHRHDPPPLTSSSQLFAWLCFLSSSAVLPPGVYTAGSKITSHLHQPGFL